MASESIGIDSESLLSVKLREYQSKIPHLPSRRQYNVRKPFPIEEFNLSIRSLFKKKKYICFIIKP